MSAGNWGGSAAGGGLDFQAAASALCMVCMARGTPLGWSAAGDDTPLSVSAESGDAGDDIAVQLPNGDLLEIQAKRKLKADSELWDALVALCRRAHEDAAFFGVLAVGPTTSVAIRDQLARDIIRLGQGRTDDLSKLAISLTERLSAASIPTIVLDRVRIQTLHLLEHDGASVQLALAHLAHITTQPAKAWERLKAEGLRLIRLRGRRDIVSVALIIPGLREIISGPLAPALVATQLLNWTLRTTETFTIPAVDRIFSLDDDWIELTAHPRDKLDVGSGSLKDALNQYHEGPAKAVAGRERDKFCAETLGYFKRQCVIVAGPGMGKTQLLRRIARLLARKREPSLLVRLRPLSERMRGGETFLEAILHIGLDSSPLTPHDVRLLGIPNLTLLMDGLDESGSEQEEIARAAAALAATYPRCRILITTRPIGYETALLNKWRHYELDLIETSDAKRSVERLVDSAVESGNAKVAEATAAATSHLDYRRENRFLAKSPLLIALLASLALNEVIAAATREGLYAQLFRLIERMTAFKRDTTKVTPAVLNAFLQQLGWELTEHPYSEVDHALAACAQRLAIELDERPLKAQSICDEAIDFWERAGIVERVRFKSSETLTFVHKTFGEYAAAQFLQSRAADERRQFLSTIEHEPHWNEVVIFASALGLGPELVRLALDQVQEGVGQTHRLLRWAKHSRDIIPADLAGPVLSRAWEIVAGPHSGDALKTGVDLVAASDNLAGAAVHAVDYRLHLQWWTALVAWACFVQANPDRLEFPALLSFMESYAEGADTRTLSSGLTLNSPVTQLWEKLLLGSAREAVRRGIGEAEQHFIDRLKESFGARSMGFIGELAFILREAGIPVVIPGQEELISKYFDSEFLEGGRKNMIALLEAVAGDAPDDAAPVDGPLLHLSAFLYGTGLMHMELSAALLATSTSGESAATQIVRLSARLSAYDYSQLLAETQAKTRMLKAPNRLAGAFDGVLSVDAPADYHRGTDSGTTPAITESLLHPSRWIVQLGTNLAEHLLTAAEIGELVSEVLKRSDGFGMAAAGYLAVNFLDKDRARELIVSRLKEPPNTGCQYLFRYLANLWIPDLDDQASAILKPALLFGPRTAKAALELTRVWNEPHRGALVLLLREAYDFWLKNEKPYPTNGGTIPESPRGEILTLLIGEGAFETESLFEATKDPRSEVSQPATSALLMALSTSESVRNELIRRIQAGERLDGVLRTCLRARVAFSQRDVQSISILLESLDPQTRYAAAGILDSQ